MDSTERKEAKNVDVNIYEDIPDFDLGEEIEKLKTENQTLTDHIKSLEEEIEKLLSTITKLKETQDNLTKNTASLFLTARAEIERKDRMIADLRTEIDNIRLRGRNPDEYKRKGQEISASEINLAKRFKSDGFNDGHQARAQLDDEQQDGSRFDGGRQDRPIFDEVHQDRPIFDDGHEDRRRFDGEHQDRRRFDGGHQDRHIFDEGHQNRPVFNDGHRDKPIFNDGHEDRRIFDDGHQDRRRFDDRYQDGHRFEDGHQDVRIFDDEHRDRPRSSSRYSSERYSSQNNRSRSGSRERFDIYRGEIGRRYDNSNRRGYGRARRFVGREKWTNDRDETRRYTNKAFDYRDSRNSTERLNYGRRDSPSTRYRDEVDQNRHEDRKTSEKIGGERQGKENFANIDKIPQSLDSKHKETKETISKEQKAKILGHVTLNSSKPEKASDVTVSKKEVPGSKPVKKRLKMLDVVEEKVKKIKSTPVKLGDSSFTNQPRRSPNRDIKGVSKSLSRDLETKRKINSDRIVRDSRKSLCNKSVKSSKTEDSKIVSSHAVRNTSPVEKHNKNINERSRNITRNDLKGVKTQGKRYLFSESSTDGNSADSTDLMANMVQKALEVLELPEKVSAQASVKEDSEEDQHSKTESGDRKDCDAYLPKEHSTTAIPTKKEISKGVTHVSHEEKASNEYSLKQKAGDESSEVKIGVMGDCKQKETDFAEDPKKNKIMAELKDDIADVCRRVWEVQADKQDQQDAEIKDAANWNVTVDHKEKEDKLTEKENKERLASKKGNKNDDFKKSDNKDKEIDKSLDKECKQKGKLKEGIKSPTEEDELEEGEIEEDEIEEKVLHRQIEKEKKGKIVAKRDATDGGMEKGDKQLEKESKGKIESQESAKNIVPNYTNERKEIDRGPEKKCGRNVGVQKGTTVTVASKMIRQDKQSENKDKSKVQWKEDNVDTAESCKSEKVTKGNKEDKGNLETKQDVNRTVDSKKEKEGKQLEKEDKKKEGKKESVNNIAESCKNQKEKNGTKQLDKDDTRNVGIKESNWKKETTERILKEAKRNLGIEATDSNFAENCKKEKGDKLTEKEDKRRMELKKNEEKQTTKRSNKEDKQNVGTNQHSSNDSAENCSIKLKDSESGKNDDEILGPQKNTEFAVESCKRKKKETDRQPKLQDRKSVELKENVTNVITHKNDGAKPEERKVSISLHMIPDSKILDETMKKAESFPNENSKGTKNSSEKDVINARKQGPIPAEKNLLEKSNAKISSKIDTAGAIKGGKISSNIPARRSSVRNTQEKIVTSEEKLRAKGLSTNKVLQKDAKVSIEGRSSRDNNPINRIVSQASHTTEQNSADLRKLSSHSKTSTTKKKENSEVSISSKNKKETSKPSEVKVPAKKVNVEITKSSEKANKTKTDTKQTLINNEESVFEDAEEGRKTEDLNLSSCESKTTKLSEASTTNPSEKSSEEYNVIKKGDPKKQKPEAETFELKMVEDCDKQSILHQTLEPSSSNITEENEKIEKNIHIIDCTIIKEADSYKQPGKDLIRMAMEGILNVDEDKIKISEANNTDIIDGNLAKLTNSSIEHPDVGIHASESETFAETNRVIKDNSSRNRIKLGDVSGESIKKSNIEHISRCRQTTAKSKSKNDSSTFCELTKQITKILRESSTSTGSLTKSNILPTTSNTGQNSSPDRPVTKRRITPTPVKDDKPKTSFENILGNTCQSTSFMNVSIRTSPLHLTHEGEIPVLHLEENHINSLPMEANVNDKNIMTLLDTMNISNVERCELPKFKSTSNETATELDTDFRNSNLDISPIRGNNNLTFENIISKSTSTPIEPANISKETATNVQNSSLGSVTNSSANTVDSTSAQTSTSTTPFIKKKRRCRLVIRD